jgi:iron complex transport system substrate-binding protein
MKNTRRGTVRAALVTAVAVGALLLTACSNTGANGGGNGNGGNADGGTNGNAANSSAWSWKDATGTTITLDHTPKRIAVLNDVAISMLHYGVKPVATFGQLPMRDDARFDGLDTDGITQLGTSYGDIDLEQLAADKPDLVITSVYPTDAKGTIDKTAPAYGFKDMEQQKQIAQIAPIAEVYWGGDGKDVIDSIADLSESLGAKRSVVDKAEATFDTAAKALGDAGKKSGLQVTSMYADGDGVYVSKASDDPALHMYKRLGVDVTDPDTKGWYWSVYSWENAGKVPGDVILLSQQGYQQAELAKQPTFADNPALDAGQVHKWTFPALDYVSQAAYMQQLTTWLGDSEKVA